ncbi:MAG: DNA gyrase/topoisomerase IV subunit A [Marinilabiliaceae bacterium]
MSDETKDEEALGGDDELEPQNPADDDALTAEAAGDAPAWDSDAVKKSRLHGMYRLWFLDYASYVILERAVPHIDDGLKPVQRRILHTMRKDENGLYNKVAGIVGDTMHFHPHGDASIGDALVQLGQKGLLIDTQGNWGNILTGDGAAAPRYIEARLTKFALDVVFSPKVTVWKESYDGRNEEPVTLPVKFPLLLAQGVEGIAVGLASKILPHNFNELIDASIAYLQGKPFTLYPDFPTGGLIDVSKYNDGLRGGVVRIRAKIEKRDARTLAITEIPFSKTTSAVIDSILKVNDKKIKVKKIEDLTAAHAEILIHLPAGASPDKTIDALYAFTDCEVSISPNACVIMDRKPHFMGVSDILRHSTDRTVDLLRQEQQILLDELAQQWHTLSLEKIFIEERIYKDKEFEEAEDIDAAVAHIDGRLKAYFESHGVTLMRDVTRDDILHLLDIKMARILKFNSQAAEDKLVSLQDEMRKTRDNIEHIVDFTIAHFRRVKKQYGAGKERLTEIRSFDNIEATKVAERNKKLYVNREDGFMGYGLKKGDYVADCSDLDDVIIFYTDGRYVVKKIDEKVDVGTGVMHIAIFKKNDTRTVYNAIYTDGETGVTFAKRFSVTGVTRDREYEITSATPGTKLRYFSANANGEAEVVKVLLRPRAKLRNVVIDFDFATLAVKGRASKGNVVTKNDVHKVVLKRKGESTLGGRQIWFERETLRLNPDGRGELLGEFGPDDKILIINNAGDAVITGTGFEQHFDDNIVRIEKFHPHKTWTAIYIDGENGLYYIKRFKIALSAKPVNFIGDNPKSKLIRVSDEDHPLFSLTYGGDDKWRPAEQIDAFEFIAEKGIKAKGKQLAKWQVGKIEELEPLIPTVREDDSADDDEAEATAAEPDEPEQPTLF